MLGLAVAVSAGRVVVVGHEPKLLDAGKGNDSDGALRVIEMTWFVGGEVTTVGVRLVVDLFLFLVGGERLFFDRQLVAVELGPAELGVGAARVGPERRVGVF